MEKQHIIKALVDIMQDVGHIGKDKKNTMQGYQFRGIDDVYNAVQPALIKHGVVVAPSFRGMVREERKSKNGGLLIFTSLIGDFTFWCMEDGSSIVVTTIGEGMDSSDKSTNKAMSAAYKYALFQALAIPTETHVDSEKESPLPAPKSRPAPQQPAPSTTPHATATQAQTRKIFALGKEKQLTSDETAKVARWHRKGDKMTKAEASALIENFDKRFDEYLESIEKKQGDL